MPTNIEALNSATNKYKAIRVMPYLQRPPGFCATLVALWIRRILQGNSIWVHKYFNDPKPPSIYFTDTTKSVKKLDAMHPTFRKNENAVEAYILGGQRPDNPSKELKDPLGRKVESQSLMSVSTPTNISSADYLNDKNKTYSFDENLTNIIATFNKIKKVKAVADFSFSSDDKSHAVALNCLTDAVQVSYFDPNLGELTFPDEQQFIDWWTECYNDRGSKAGAFSALGYSYGYTMYAKNISSSPKKPVVSNLYTEELTAKEDEELAAMIAKCGLY